MRPLFQATAAFLVVASFVLFSGCNSEKLATVTGVVTLDGKPVQGLEVNFEPTGSTEGRTTGTGYTQADGSYSLYYPGFKKGSPTGEYVVRISGSESLDDGTKVRVPAKYNAQSELKREVVPGDNKIDFELTSK